MLRCGLLALALVLVAGACWADILSWKGYDWDTAPIAGQTTPGTWSIGALDVLQNGPLGSASKVYWWPPYSIINSSWAERFAAARLINMPAPAASIHAKVFDPYTTGKNGWSVILEDDTGKFFDFGIRPFLATKQIIPHQYNGSAWTNSPVMTRGATNNAYYTLDFVKNLDGTISWAIDANENGYIWSSSGTSVVAYGNITGVYLVATTSDTSTNTYKWTEFSYVPVPEPSSILAFGTGLLGLAGVAVRRRK